LFEEFRLGHCAVMMLEEVAKDLECFGLDGHGLPSPPQLIPYIVECVVAEDIVHTATPSLATEAPIASATQMLFAPRGEKSTLATHEDREKHDKMCYSDTIRYTKRP
jgi:hypothetical protein